MGVPVGHSGPSGTSTLVPGLVGSETNGRLPVQLCHRDARLVVHPPRIITGAAKIRKGKALVTACYIAVNDRHAALSITFIVPGDDHAKVACDPLRIPAFLLMR